MTLLQIKNWRNPGWLTPKQLEVCRDLFDGTDPDFGTDRFREYLAEELCSYMAREYAKEVPSELQPCPPVATYGFLYKLALIRNAVYTLHVAFNQQETR